MSSPSSNGALTPETVAIIKATIPALEAHGLDITSEMYRRLLADPAIREMFDPTHQASGAQPRALAMAVLAYARHIDDLGVLGSAVERIAQKHASLEILPEHYPHVATALIGAITQVLGDAATPEILDAWGKAYWALANILIGREHQIYDASTHAAGGWTGWRDFTITSTTQECEGVTSLHLKPVDGKPVIKALAGQALGVDLDVPGHGQTRRNYSITSTPGTDGYRISVRHVEGGIVSSWLNSADCVQHVVRLSPPAGNFTLPADRSAPVTLLCAGIGITPFLPMLELIAEDPSGAPVTLVQIAHSAQAIPFAERIAELSAASNGRIRVETRLTASEGRPCATWAASFVPQGASCYVCGPAGFMRDMITGLQKAGIPAERLRYETFGPDTGLTA